MTIDQYLEAQFKTELSGVDLVRIVHFPETEGTGAIVFVDDMPFLWYCQAGSDDDEWVFVRSGFPDQVVRIAFE
jgi:hypothetical protein